MMIWEAFDFQHVARGGTQGVALGAPRALPWAVLSRPFRAVMRFQSSPPRALPWAVLFRPFRAARFLNATRG